MIELGQTEPNLYSPHLAVSIQNGQFQLFGQFV